jgi:hypothetical protein
MFQRTRGKKKILCTEFAGRAFMFPFNKCIGHYLKLHEILSQLLINV